MKHVIMGTAGHVDHGKTALVRALTGIECDTHPAEKQRGITINLGFAFLPLPGGDTVGIVDVPGHRDFVHTMVSGACAVDFALLVVAADEGIMPQTREHLQILQVLGIKKGIVAMTKCDLVDADVMEMAIEEVRELTAGTFLEACPVAQVSSVTGAGIEELKQQIAAMEATVAERPAGEIFRLFIDRIFSVSGFGTVVTGSVLSGRIRTEQKAYMLPGARELRVRRLEHHGRQVDEVAAGQRASMNLVGLNREDFRRGMVIADRELRESVLVDAQLTLFQHGRPLDIWSQEIFLLGTYEAQARIHLVDRDRLAAGQTGIVQIHLPQPVAVISGDRFVIRSSSSDITLGGGEVLDAAPLHHRRRPPELVENLQRLTEGRLRELIAAETRKHPGGISHRALAAILNVAAAEIEAEIGRALPDDIRRYDAGGVCYLIGDAQRRRLADTVSRTLETFHRRNPLLDEGRRTDELLGMLGLGQNADNEQVLRLVLDELCRDGALKKVGNTYALASHSVTLSPAMTRQISFVEGYLKKCGLQVPLVTELTAEAARQGIDEPSLRQVLRYLVGKRLAYAAEGSYVYAPLVDDIRRRLLEALRKNSGGLTVAQFRDLIQGNRKLCLMLLAIYDGEGVTSREGDVRVITDKGRAVLAEAARP